MRIRLKLIALVLPLVLAGCGGMAGNTSANPNSAPPPPPPPPPSTPADLTAVNHIIFMMQENQSFDRYFGQLNTYRQARGLGPRWRLRLPLRHNSRLTADFVHAISHAIYVRRGAELVLE
jgi:hypothetical protein